ncbi:ImmA/IrrE family metallo-endopeptidase [Clostridium tetani]|uniref:ImmA/IrrE family metallo-endopeptidase n=1 Tax=Clostridium tetani TaxID=1513 RepID=UPI00100ACAC5|nr:ImmA/IrrE family metallo-endopeptidase [Clostridium tetani]RXM78653.1 ImmA/IrrE family metallo-endopeptidase [Clostridium tetani]RYU99747.1 ImmA/IrrE family metallo-endopeptidase [Clostridium tetani]
MRQDEIIKLAKSLKKQYTTNPIKICNKLGIDINYTNLKPNIYAAYTTRIGKKPVIRLNSHFTLKSQKVLCAHELGHALMHGNKLINEFNDNHNGVNEYEANLFAVALLFDETDFAMDIKQMDNYMLKGILDYNIRLK